MYRTNGGLVLLSYDCHIQIYISCIMFHQTNTLTIIHNYNTHIHLSLLICVRETDTFKTIECCCCFFPFFGMSLSVCVRVCVSTPRLHMMARNVCLVYGRCQIPKTILGLIQNKNLLSDLLSVLAFEPRTALRCLGPRMDHLD